MFSIVGCFYPYNSVLSYRTERESRRYDQLKDVPKNLSDFYYVISTESGFSAFHEFLVGEFSVESLYFFQAVEDFRETALLTLNYHAFGDADSDFLYQDSAMEVINKINHSYTVLCVKNNTQ